MTKTEKARQQWILVYNIKGKGSKEEIEAYKAYVKISMKENKKNNDEGMD